MELNDDDFRQLEAFYKIYTDYRDRLKEKYRDCYFILKPYHGVVYAYFRQGEQYKISTFVTSESGIQVTNYEKSTGVTRFINLDEIDIIGN